MQAEYERRLPFSVSEFQRRLALVRDEIAARGFDAAVINSPENIYYLTGYQTLGYFAYQVLVIPLEAEPCLLVRYGEKSNVLGRSWLQNMELYRDTEDPVAVTRRVLQRTRAKRIGIEAESWFLTPALYKRVLAAMPDVEFKDCSGLVETHRVVKSAEELAYVEAAAKISSTAVRAGIQAMIKAKTDREVAAVVHSALILAGGEYPPLPAFVTVGPQTTLFHNTWSGQTIGDGDLVFLEVPGVVGRYLAPVARCAAKGEPPAYVVERYKVAVESLECGIEAMRPGVTCAEVYDAFAAPYIRAGYDVPIKVGYSVGINFPPRWVEQGGLELLPNNHTVLRSGMVFHTPRTVRVFGDQTPIVSETILITDTGHRVLTDAPRELVRC